MISGWGDTIGGEAQEVHPGGGENTLLGVDGESVFFKDGEDGGQVFVVRNLVLAGNEMVI